MKYVGFIKEQNNIPEASCFNEVIGASINTDIDKVIKYLEKGMYCCGCLGVFNDLNNNDFICNHYYLTDGLYIWPSYFIYYLKKYPNYIIDNHFLNYLKTKKFVFKKINFFKRKSIEKMEDYLGDKLIETSRPSI